MFSQVSFILFIGGQAWQGACMEWGVHGKGAMRGWGHTWQGSCMAGWMLGRGHVW